MSKMLPDTEVLVRANAASLGLMSDEVVRVGLSRVGDALPWCAHPSAKTKDDLISGMEEISARSAARTVLDPRAPDEIIGYDEFGVPR
jgi:hypothetical protein